MPEVTPDSRLQDGGAGTIIGAATDEVRLAQDRARAAAAAVAAARATKGRLMAVALAVAVPVLAALLAVNLFGVSAADLFTPAPPAAIARRDAQADLDAMVQGIEGFRDDYAALPDSLAEVASTPPGTWTYARTAGGGYRVTVARHGQIVTFSSGPERK